ncbi:hypothetical protein [Elioraea thermophila]|uniref:hypothetical protein n=1 Tax=Elioraea thermophila TaxID=2185104 RepID=UPI00130030E4|nr:hypothetical protein [Elioraea thermophila]
MIDPLRLVERIAAVGAARADMRAMVGSGRVDRDTLEAVLARLAALAARRALFGTGEFAGGDRPARFVLAEDADGGLALSLVVHPPGFTAEPHAHGTWAAIAAVEGVEVHRLYRQSPRGLEVIDEVVLRPGAGVVLMPDDIHAVRVPGPGPARLLQLHGLAPHRAPRQEYAAPVEQAWPAARAEAG